jgi:hypothetical protein
MEKIYEEKGLSRDNISVDCNCFIMLRYGQLPEVRNNMIKPAVSLNLFCSQAIAYVSLN